MSATATATTAAAIPASVPLSDITTGERFSPVTMPYAVFALMFVAGRRTAPAAVRWAVVIDIAEDCWHMQHGQLIKLDPETSVFRVGQVMPAKYKRVARLTQ